MMMMVMMMDIMRDIMGDVGYHRMYNLPTAGKREKNEVMKCLNFSLRLMMGLPGPHGRLPYYSHMNPQEYGKHMEIRVPSLEVPIHSLKLHRCLRPC